MAAFAYTDAEKVKVELELGHDQEFTDDLDGLLADMVEQASRMIDGFKGVDPGAYKTDDVGLAADSGTDETRFFFGSGVTLQPIDHATNIAEVAIEETDNTFTVWVLDTDYFTLPYNAALISEPIRRLEVTGKTGSTKSIFRYGPKTIRVKGKFGIAALPPAGIARAALIQSQRWYMRALQGWQETGAVAELNQLRFTQKLDPDVEQILAVTFPHVSRVFV